MAFKSTAISITILSTLFFFIIFHNNPSPKPHHRILLSSPSLFNSTPSLSIPLLLLTLLLHFYILITTAQAHFSIVVTTLAKTLNLSPSLAAVTLLALGNGAPDVFASVAAVRGGKMRTGFSAILSAGTFVSAFVVGFVAIYAAPFGVDAGGFVRDVGFYLVAVLFLFYVYLSAEIYLWQAVGFVGFYLFFVGVVLWMDFGGGKTQEEGKLNREGREEVRLLDHGKAREGREEVRLIDHGKNREGRDEVRWMDNGKARERREEVRLMDHGDLSGGGKEMDCESGGFSRRLEDVKEERFGFWGALGKVSQVWKKPILVLLKLTIPETSPSDWNRFYQSANVALCPLALLYSCKSFMPLDHPISFLLPNIHFPLWSLVLFCSCSLAILHYLVEKEPPKTEQLHTVLVAFVMSVFWISTVAGELLNCLEALGILLELPASLLGLTVLAWGNSVGDLVADVAVAKAGQPAMAMAGCFAGPMFNMLFGLGTALVIQTADVYPEAYELHFHVSIVVAFIFLLMSLMGSLLVVTWHRFRVPRFWGFCLVGLYVVFMVLSLIIAKFSA